MFNREIALYTFFIASALLAGLVLAPIFIGDLGFADQEYAGALATLLWLYFLPILGLCYLVTVFLSMAAIFRSERTVKIRILIFHAIFLLTLNVALKLTWTLEGRLKVVVILMILAGLAAALILPVKWLLGTRAR